MTLGGNVHLNMFIDETGAAQRQAKRAVRRGAILVAHLLEGACELPTSARGEGEHPSRKLGSGAASAPSPHRPLFSEE